MKTFGNSGFSINVLSIKFKHFYKGMSESKSYSAYFLWELLSAIQMLTQPFFHLGKFSSLYLLYHFDTTDTLDAHGFII